MKEKKYFITGSLCARSPAPFYKNNFGFKIGDFPIAEIFYERELSIPMYPALTSDDLVLYH